MRNRYQVLEQIEKQQDAYLPYPSEQRSMVCIAMQVFAEEFAIGFTEWLTSNACNFDFIEEKNHSITEYIEEYKRTLYAS